MVVEFLKNDKGNKKRIELRAPLHNYKLKSSQVMLQNISSEQKHNPDLYQHVNTVNLAYNGLRYS